MTAVTATKQKKKRKGKLDGGWWQRGFKVSVNEARSFRCAGGRSRRWSLGRSRTWTGKSTPVDLRSGRGRTKTFNWVFRLDAAGGLARSGCSPLPLQTKGNAFWGVHAW
jgi:hypothetical protein